MFKLKRQEVQIGPLTAIDAAVLLVLILLQRLPLLVFHCIGEIDGFGGELTCVDEAIHGWHRDLKFRIVFDDVIDRLFIGHPVFDRLIQLAIFFIRLIQALS